VAQAVGIVGRISLAWMSDHFWPGKRLRSLSWTMAFCAAAVMGLMALPAQSPTWMILSVFVTLGLFGIGWYPLWLVEVAEMASPNAVAWTISFAMTLNLVAISVMPPVFGLLVDRSGYPLAWMSLVVLLVLAAFNLQRSRRKSDGKGGESSSIGRGAPKIGTPADLPN
jgi:predicted MFS family arabinose efflux permease